MINHSSKTSSRTRTAMGAHGDSQTELLGTLRTSNGRVAKDSGLGEGWCTSAFRNPCLLNPHSSASLSKIVWFAGKGIAIKSSFSMWLIYHAL